MSVEIRAPLPPLRTKIRRSFFLLIGLYSFLGFFVAFGIFLASGTAPFDKGTLLGSFISFILALALALLLAENLSSRLAKPIKAIAEVLRNHPPLDRKLKLPKATSSEMRILTDEIKALWERIRHFQKINVSSLQEEREKLEIVLGSVEDAVLLLDEHGRVLQCNSGMLKLLGLEKESVIGSFWKDLSTANQNYLSIREKLISNLSLDNTLSLEVQGEVRLFGARRRTISNPFHQTLGVLYLLHDITQTRNREQLKAEFIRILSHELKAPLEALGLESRQLSDSSIPKETRELAEKIHEDIARIRSIAHDFIQLGSVDFDSLKLKLQKRPLSQNLHEWIEPFRVLARDKNVKIELIHEGSEVIWANIDEVKFHWVVSNLIGNALRATPANSTITIYLTDRANLAQIEIRDEGVEIPLENQDKIFDSQNNFKSLGLMISKQILEAHEGMIEYFPQKNKGSTFRVSLPNLVVIHSAS